MENQKITTIQRIYTDQKLGDLIFKDAASTIERTDDRIVIKVMAPKDRSNWLQLNDHMLCSMALIRRWAHSLQLAGFNRFIQIPAIPRDEQLEQLREEDEQMNLENPEIGSAFDYTYFYDLQNWVMYEGIQNYLFLYEMEIKDAYNLAISSQTEALAFWPADDFGHFSDFLESWYFRVNGFPEDKD